MGYILKTLKGKRTWKVQFQTYKGGLRRAKDIKPDDYFRLGLHASMVHNEVRERLKQLNSQEALKDLQAKRNNIYERLREEETVVNAFLPELLRQEFEEHFIEKKTKKVSHWHTAKKLIATVRLDSADWGYYKNQWYSLFKSKQFSIDYVQKLTLVLNKWGKFVAYKQRTFFDPIPMPTGIDKQRIVDAFEEKGTTKVSNPITPEQLETTLQLISPEAYNWLYISIWLGLRPDEVDSLLEPSGPITWRLEKNILWVFQNKLKGIPTKDKWKPIVLKYPEQLKCLTIMKSKEFKRPLNKTLKLHFGGQTTCYGGRKNFVDMMLSKGNRLEAISMWLGHKSLNRTWQHYKDKKKVLTE